MVVKGVKELRKEYFKKKSLIKKRLNEFKKNKDIFYELCFCILTPQSNAKKCYEAVRILKEKDFLNKDFDVKPVLRTRTRFYKNKAKYLALAKNNFSEIRKYLDKTGFEAREDLVKNVKGISYKETSHYLRNTGYRNLAILDRHILKNLHKHNVIEILPKHLNKKIYLDIERRFALFSKIAKIPMDELDLLFWSIETGRIFR